MKCVFAVALLLMVLVAGRAEDQKWTLTDGSTVTVMKVLSQNGTHVTVRCPEGILQIDKRRLPEDLKAHYPYDAAAAPSVGTAPAQQPQPAAAQRPVRAANKGSVSLEIVGVRSVERALSYVSVTNHSDAEIDLRREMLGGRNANGARVPVARFTNERGDLLVSIKMAPHSTVELWVVFDLPAGDVGNISSVFFVQQ